MELLRQTQAVCTLQFLFDLNQLLDAINYKFITIFSNFSYHHTISATLLYGLREALANVCKEGLEKSIERHQKCAGVLRIGLNEMGLELFVKNPAYRLPTITSVEIPKDIDWKKIAEIGDKEYVLINTIAKIYL